MITYSSEIPITPEEFTRILMKATLGERRPINDSDRIARMVKNAGITVTAWNDNSNLIGVARSISDFAYCTYLSDLAVHKDYQKQGVGKEVIRKTREVTGEDVALIVIAAPAASEYYSHIGFTKIDRTWVLMPGTQLAQISNEIRKVWNSSGLVE